MVVDWQGENLKEKFLVQYKTCYNTISLSGKK